MKRITCFLFTLLSLIPSNAQVAQWLVPPEYDWIEVSFDYHVITAQQGFNHHIWNMDGKCLAKITDDFFAFSDGHAVTTMPETAKITAIYDTEGNKTAIEDQVQLGWGYPYFHDGFLVVNDGNYFYFMDNDGGVDTKPYYQSFPFSHGYATCFTFGSLHKMKDPMWLLLNKELEQVPLKWANKPMSPGDIDFISSVGDDGMAIIAYKGKLYYFDAATAELSPVLPLSGDTNIKNQARYDDSITEILIRETTDSIKTLTGKCGKASLTLTIENITHKPLTLTIGSDERVFKRPIVRRNQSPFTVKGVKDPASGKFALYMGSTEILPPQLDEVKNISGSIVQVNMNDKVGLLRVNPDDHFAFSLNDNEDIGFRHKHFNTAIRLNMPAYILAEETSIEIDPQTGCDIDKRSKEAKNNPDGSYVKYRCKLVCPEDVGDDPKEYSYPAYIVYQRLRTPMTVATAKAWHSKYFTVDVNEQELKLTGNTLQFTINVSADRVQGDEVFPFIPSLATEDLEFEMEKVSDTRYKCVVHDLKQGKNIIIVRITEEGCPPSDYTFEVTYEPRSTQKEKRVTVVKKEITTPQPAKPHLEI